MGVEYHGGDFQGNKLVEIYALVTFQLINLPSNDTPTIHKMEGFTL